MLTETQTRHTDWSKENQKNSLILTMAILKVYNAKHEANKVITFDLKEATSLRVQRLTLLYVVPG